MENLRVKTMLAPLQDDGSMSKEQFVYWSEAGIVSTFTQLPIPAVMELSEKQFQQYLGLAIAFREMQRAIAQAQAEVEMRHASMPKLLVPQ